MEDTYCLRVKRNIENILHEQLTANIDNKKVDLLYSLYGNIINKTSLRVGEKYEKVPRVYE